MLDWIANNMETIVLGWGMLLATFEFLKRVIPGTKDDEILVKVADIGGKILTLGGSTLLPNQEGNLKK